MKILFVFVLAWQVKAAESANADSAQMVEDFEIENMESDAAMAEEESEKVESGEGSNETWFYHGKWHKGKKLKTAHKKEFVLKYYPEQRQGLYLWHHNRGGRRRHWMLRPEWLKKSGKESVLQDFEEKKGPLKKGFKIYNRQTGKCLDAARDHEDDLCFWHCHNHGNQHFWFEAWGDDEKLGATHIHIGGNMRSRRRHSCVDMGGGRLYIHNCHTGNNQRWVIKAATTTTSTTTSTTTKVELKMITSSFPEKIEWIIHDITENIRKPKPMPGCNGKVYTSWYSEHSTGCKLTKGRRYRITCYDKMYKEGWAGGYLKIGNKKICHDFHWGQKKSSKVVMYPN